VKVTNCDFLSGRYSEQLLAWLGRVSDCTRDLNTRFGSDAFCPLPSLRPHRPSYPTRQTTLTTQCPRIRTIRLLQRLHQTSRPSLRMLWRSTRNGRRKTLPLIAWLPISSPANLLRPFSPSFKLKFRPLIHLQVPMKGGQAC
jgi:hypothetical protein